MPREPRPQPANSLERALVILEVIERAPGGLTNAEISRCLDIATSTCSYILRRLEQGGYLTRILETGRYCIGLTPVALAHGALREMGFRSRAEPILYWLTHETGLSASLGVLERRKIMLVDRLESPRFANEAAETARRIGSRWRRGPGDECFDRMRRRDVRDIGRELPIHTNALGKAVLAHLSAKEIEEIISDEGLTRSTPYTILSEKRLLAELEQIRKQGYAVSREEQYIGVFGVAAPIFDSSLKILAAVSITGPPTDQAWNQLPELIDLVKSAGHKISVLA
jgi:IclR family transcriptional regulator, acetate operon repressor